MKIILWLFIHFCKKLMHVYICFCIAAIFSIAVIDFVTIPFNVKMGFSAYYLHFVGSYCLEPTDTL